MDSLVSRAMAKWPAVPAVYGWLALDRRGEWLLKRSAAGGLEPISQQSWKEYIARNYACSANGEWYFQNGPQRVYVALDYTPYVHRIAAPHPLCLETHTRLACSRFSAAYIDETGNLVLMSEHGPGVLLDRDLARVLEALREADGRTLDEARLLGLCEPGGDVSGVYLSIGGGRVALQRIRSGELEQRLGYVREPRTPKS